MQARALKKSATALLLMATLSTIACAPQPIVVNAISKDCVLFRTLYLSADAIAALRERQDQLFKEGHFERAANVLFDRKRIGDHNEIWETECQKPAAAK